MKKPYKIVWRRHAYERMGQRNIHKSDVEHVLKTGEAIEDYPEDTPYPSRLICGWTKSRPLHVVAATNEVDNELIVITAYEPDAEQWDSAFTRRKKP